MIRLERVPAAHLIAGGLCAGLAVSLLVRVEGRLAALVGATLAVASPWLTGGRRPAALALALASAGLWWGSARLDVIDASELEPSVGESGFFRAEVTGPARRGTFATRLPVRVRALDGRDVDEPARLELPLGRGPPQGALIDLVATVRRPQAAEEPGEFDEAGYLRRQGVHVVLRAETYRVVGRRGGLPGVADRLRLALARSIAPGLEGERRAVVAGIVLGEDEGLDDGLRDAFRASGLYHLLAVSGQNVAFVVLGAILLAWSVGLPRRAGQAAALVGVIGYVSAVGWQPSVVRAGVAGGLASLAWLASRPADRWYFFLLGAALLLAVNPYALLEPGFQLSFAAVAAIFVLVPRVSRTLEGYPVPRRLADVVAISAACGFATAPVLWLHFGAVPVFSVVANAIATPVVAPILGLGLASAGLAQVLPGAATALAFANGWLAAYLAWCARLVGGLPFAQATSVRALVAGLVAVAFVVVAVRLRPPRRARLVGLAAMAATLAVGWKLLLASVGAAPPAPAGLRVTFLDVGQGDAVLVEVPEGAILVDQGPPEGRVSEQLDALGIDSLAALVLTHPQRDHVGGAAEVLAGTKVGFVLDPSIASESPDEKAALREARQRGVRIVVARVGLRFRLGRLRLQVLWPDDSAAPSGDPNDRAVVLLATYGMTDVLLTADAETNVTLPLRPPPVEVLKVAHHGSADDGLPELLRLTRPRVAVVSVGERNDYGHPKPSTIHALAEAPGLDVHRTDDDGRVVVESNGRGLTVTTER